MRAFALVLVLTMAVVGGTVTPPADAVTALRVAIVGTQVRLDGLETFIDGNEVVEECEGPNKVAQNTIDVLRPRLQAASSRLRGKTLDEIRALCGGG